MTKQEAFLLSPTMVAWPLQNFVKILSMDLTFCWWHLCKFFKNHKSKKSLNFSFRHYQVFSESTRANERLKRAIYQKGVCVQLGKVLKLIATNTLSFHWS